MGLGEGPTVYISEDSQVMLMTLRIKGLEAGSQPTGPQALYPDPVTRSLSHSLPFAAWSQSLVPGFLTLNPIDLLGQIILCCGLSCAL